jgi:hypothetical protein
VPAVILPLETLSRLMGRRIDGILGFHFLRQFIVEMDYDAVRVRFHQPGAFSPPAAWRELRIELEGGRPAVSATLQFGNGPPIAAQFVLDTGSNSVLTLLPDFASRHQLPPRGARTLDDPAFGVAGASPALLFAASQLRLGELEIAAPPVRVRQEGSGKGEGLIGGAVLRGFRFAIDYRRQKLYLGRGARFGEPMAVDLAGMRLVWEGPEFNQPRIDAILPGRAAERAGLRAGDAIESLAGIPAPKLDLNDIAARLRVAGSAVPIVARRGEQKIEIELRLLPLP